MKSASLPHHCMNAPKTSRTRVNRERREHFRGTRRESRPGRCPPKAEVDGSNPFGSANFLKQLAVTESARQGVSEALRLD